jgi:hypothetical protein
MTIDKSTIEGVLYYDESICETVEDHLVQQTAVLKKAAYLFDEVFNNHKKTLEKLHNSLKILSDIIGHNTTTLNDMIQELKARVEILESNKKLN